MKYFEKTNRGMHLICKFVKPTIFFALIIISLHKIKDAKGIIDGLIDDIFLY